MYIGRSMDELVQVPLHEWEIHELAFFHHVMSQLVMVMNQQGVSLLHRIIDEMKRRNALAHDSGGWDHASRIIYD